MDDDLLNIMLLDLDSVGHVLTLFNAYKQIPTKQDNRANGKTVM